jgi:aspartate/methionine/tyrosine aminotransferase
VGEPKRTTRSPYMEFAKTGIVDVPFPLTSSGLESIDLARFPVLLEDLTADLTGDPALSVPGNYGYEPVQEALALHTGADPACIVPAGGASMSNHLAMAAVLTQPGDQVLIESPSYPLLFDTARYLLTDVHSFDREPVDYSVDPDRISAVIEGRMRGAERLRRLRLIVLTNLHNPSSALLDSETLREIGEIAERHGARVLVDETYLAAMLENTPRSAFFLGPTFITTNSLTKVYGLSGLRCGWILAQPALARQIWQMVDLFDVNPPHIAQRLSVVALRELARGEDSAIRRNARELLCRNIELLNRFLSSRDDLCVRLHSHGTTSFPRLTRGTAGELVALAERRGTSITDGRFFEAPEHFRIGIGARSDVVEEGLARLGDALDELAKLNVSSRSAH